MMTLCNGEVVSEDESDDDDDLSDMPPLEDPSNVEGDEPVTKGPIFKLLARHALSMQAKEDEVQHKNIFHTRCIIDNKLCSMIINGGSCTNVVNAGLVNKLGLKTIKHPRPYRL